MPTDVRAVMGLKSEDPTVGITGNSLSLSWAGSLFAALIAVIVSFREDRIASTSLDRWLRFYRWGGQNAL